MIEEGNEKGIKVGKYIIRSDAFNIWVDKETKLNAKGEMNYERVAGYCSNFEDLMINFMENRIRGKEMKEVDKILKTIGTAEAEAKKLIRAYMKAQGVDSVKKGAKK